MQASDNEIDEAAKNLLRGLLSGTEIRPRKALLSASEDVVKGVYRMLVLHSGEAGTQIENVSGLPAMVDKIVEFLDGLETIASSTPMNSSVSGTIGRGNSLEFQEQQPRIAPKPGRHLFASSIPSKKLDAALKSIDKDKLSEMPTKFLPMAEMLRLMRIEYSSPKKIRKLLGVIMEALCLESDKEIELDDGKRFLPKQIFFYASKASKNRGGFTYYADTRATGYLLDKMGLLPLISEDEKKKFVSPSLALDRLASDSEGAITATARPYIGLIAQEIWNETSEAINEPFAIFRRYPGGSRQIYLDYDRCKPLIIEKLHNKGIVCKPNWLTPSEFLDKLGVNKHSANAKALSDILSEYLKLDSIVIGDKVCPRHDLVQSFAFGRHVRVSPEFAEAGLISKSSVEEKRQANLRKARGVGQIAPEGWLSVRGLLLRLGMAPGGANNKAASSILEDIMAVGTMSVNGVQVSTNSMIDRFTIDNRIMFDPVLLDHVSITKEMIINRRNEMRARE